MSPVTRPAPRALRVLDSKRDRSCGSCQECCTAGHVPETGKPGGVRCPSLRLGKPGCSVHGTDAQPASCTSFRCLWLQGVGPDSNRPDRIGVFFALHEIPDAPMHPDVPGAFGRQNLSGQSGRGIVAVECWKDAGRTTAKTALDEIKSVAPIAFVPFPTPAPKAST